METTLQNAHQNMWMETRLLLHAWCTVEISILNSTCVWSKLKRHPWKIVLCWYRRKKNNPLFLEVKTSFKCIKVPFIRRWPFYLSLWQKMVHTNKQASALTDGFEERRITHWLMRWKKSDPIFQTSLAVSCQKISSFLAWNSANFERSLVLVDVFSFLPTERDTLYVLKLPFVVSAQWFSRVTRVMWGTLGVDVSGGVLVFHLLSHLFPSLCTQ